MSRGTALLRPTSPLDAHVEFLGSWDRGSGAENRSWAVPRGALTVIIDVAGNSDLCLYAADGHTRLQVPPAFVAGAGTTPYIIHLTPDQAVMTIHFRPGGAWAFLGTALGELENCCVGLDQLLGASATVLRERLVETPLRTARIGLIEQFLLQRMATGYTGHSPAVSSTLAEIERTPSMRIAAAREAAGLSPKRFTALFRDEVGLAPKSFQRVRRVQAALRRLDSDRASGATIASELGYFDQAHFVRDFRQFTAHTPTQYVQSRSALPGHVNLGEPPGGRQKYPSQEPGSRRR
ncbi:helix-turn-helix domain-containing protein [Mycobacterium sp. IS-3022]|uniref:helix-turn-helix domain-containing protein n=1 Tax=Mycobacterium sp. IS-3022 TaxID=1772277 RepID=UPI000741549F|nr:helix-turn-helix domain-containing protein [Mycobacterium sp. IS-3022]KUH94510.1 hypothetical protein AU188_13415 [Mycobacterium sp. IS-3022]